MNKILASLLLPYISPLPFADLVGGLAQVITTGNRAEGGKGLRKFPATQTVAAPRTVTSVYQDLTPNTQYKSIMFFESNDCRVLGRERNSINLKSVIRIVGWLNVKSTETTDVEALIAIISNLPEGPFNSVANKLTRIQIASTKVVDNNIFSRYTFDESARQYLMYPYQAFCLELEITFSVTPSPKCT